MAATTVCRTNLYRPFSATKARWRVPSRCGRRRIRQAIHAGVTACYHCDGCRSEAQYTSQAQETPQPPPLRSGWSQVVRGKAGAGPDDAREVRTSEPATSAAASVKRAESGGSGAKTPPARSPSRPAGAEGGAGSSTSGATAAEAAMPAISAASVRPNLESCHIDAEKQGSKATEQPVAAIGGVAATATSSAVQADGESSRQAQATTAAADASEPGSSRTEQPPVEPSKPSKPAWNKVGGLHLALLGGPR